MIKVTKKVLLKGEGTNVHVLHGNLQVEDTDRDFSCIVVDKDGILKHETPNGGKAEHESLKIAADDWVMGKQVEWNPFSRSISQIWD